MKKIIASILSLTILLGSVRNVSFANGTLQMENNFTIKTNFPTQPTTKTPELTEKEKQELKVENYAQKLEKELNEKLKDSYSDIMEENPCMKVAFKEVQLLLCGPFINFRAKEKLDVLCAEKKSLLSYKKTLQEKTNYSENTIKQIKNIDNRLQAIEYTEKCLENYLNAKNSRFWKELGKATFGIMAIFLGINGLAYLLLKFCS